MIEAGSDVDAYCGKCKLVLAHVIVAMKGTRPARVECKTCNATHAYKKEVPRKETTTKRTTKTTRAAQLAAYEALMDGHNLTTATKYKTNVILNDQEVVDHKTFGLGLVVRILSDNKVEVAFQTGSKVLVHSR